MVPLVSAYAVFLGPIGAILVWDFWWVHDRKYDVLALYHPDRWVSTRYLSCCFTKRATAYTGTAMDVIGEPS